MREVLPALQTFYGPLAAPPQDLFAFFVWEVLSVRTLPARRDMAWQALRRLPALTPDAVFQASKADLERALEMVPERIHRVEIIKTGAGHFRRHRGLTQMVSGTLKTARRALADVPHLSEASQDRALLFAGGHAVAAVDAATARFLARWQGWAAAGPRLLQRRARRHVFNAANGVLDSLRDAVLLFGHHAAHACGDQPHCAVCPLAGTCAHAQAGVAPVS